MTIELILLSAINMNESKLGSVFNVIFDTETGKNMAVRFAVMVTPTKDGIRYMTSTGMNGYGKVSFVNMITTIAFV